MFSSMSVNLSQEAGIFNLIEKYAWHGHDTYHEICRKMDLKKQETKFLQVIYCSFRIV